MGMIQDFHDHTVFGDGSGPRTWTSTFDTPFVDLNGGSGKCLALLMVGVVSGSSPTLDVKVQDSPDHVTWTDVGGATFAQVTTLDDTPQMITFTRTNRYVRMHGTIGGGTPSFGVSQFFAQATAEGGQGKRAGESGGRAG